MIPLEWKKEIDLRIHNKQDFNFSFQLDIKPIHFSELRSYINNAIDDYLRIKTKDQKESKLYNFLRKLRPENEEDELNKYKDYFNSLKGQEETKSPLPKRNKLGSYSKLTKNIRNFKFDPTEDSSQNISNSNSISKSNEKEIPTRKIKKRTKEKQPESVNFLKNLINEKVSVLDTTSFLKDYIKMLGIDKDDFNRILTNSEIKEYNQGEIIYYYSTKINYLYIVLQGEVENVYKDTDIRINIFQEGFIFGDNQFIYKNYSTSTTTVISNKAKILQIERKYLESELKIYNCFLKSQQSIRNNLKKLFPIMTPHFIKELQSKIDFSLYLRDEIIYKQGDQANYFFILWYGEFNLCCIYKKLLKNTITITSKGMLIGKECFGKNKYYKNTLVAKKDFNMVFKIHTSILNTYYLYFDEDEMTNHIDETCQINSKNLKIYENKFKVNFNEETLKKKTVDRKKFIEMTSEKKFKRILKDINQKSAAKKILKNSIETIEVSSNVTYSKTNKEKENSINLKNKTKENFRINRTNNFFNNELLVSKVDMYLNKTNTDGIDSKRLTKTDEDDFFLTRIENIQHPLEEDQKSKEVKIKIGNLSSEIQTQTYSQDQNLTLRKKEPLNFVGINDCIAYSAKRWIDYTKSANYDSGGLILPLIYN